ncbi:cobyric acid synthase [Thermosynechococcus sp. HN-54]|uniref:cobyric acid synthase n=1 Tax=Thermosynechococcus sp. HN-54 TaxID=2933959 RepID=UPI00202CB3F3|nr:cobyric acid synthase [Thermosynechococcus sp. HN-54]URR36601.1 cobyric acid synthase [Thermosynechococcus sp. HN-54]
MTAKALMVVGTTSHAGKSLLTAVICRWLAQQGYRVTPFKGQNMALNAYVTRDGGEIGYAQAMQAWAAGIEPEVAMNPILLKPQGNMTSQVILKGQVAGVTQAADYYRDYFERGWQAITEALADLRQRFDWIVCEGAGSPAEINLKHRDLTNMRVATSLGAPTILVADIDRGGVFAHIVGTLMLLDPAEQALIQGIVINKFRGQRSLLESGLQWLEETTGVPVLGVIPWLEDHYAAEDSLDLWDPRPQRQGADLKITVIRLPRIANFTDVDPLLAEPSVSLEFLLPHRPLGQPDAVILPGTKTTIADLHVLRETGMADQLQAYAAQGGTILGICGGWQILGTTISDSLGLEGYRGTHTGLGLMPLHTELATTKCTQQRQTQSVYFSCPEPILGYEIHQGQSNYDPDLKGWQPLFADAALGIVNEAATLWGTYLHGLLENGSWRRHWLNVLRSRRQLPPLPTAIPHYAQQRAVALDQLTASVMAHLNLEGICKLC